MAKKVIKKTKHIEQTKAETRNGNDFIQFIYANYEDKDVSGGEICEGDEDSTWPCHEDIIREFRVLSVSPDRNGTYVEEVPCHLKLDAEGKLPTHLIVVVVRYTDGGTFGRTVGYGSVQGVFGNYADAELRKRQLENLDRKDTSYKPWDGYFARMNGIEIYPVPVLQ